MKHVHLYAVEVESRFNNRTASSVGDQAKAVTGQLETVGRRLLYRNQSLA